MDLIERRGAGLAHTSAPSRLSWISVAPDAPYFVDGEGRDFTPIGQNDAISWVELEGLFERRDLESVERHLERLRDSGVTVLRLMLEYAQVRTRYFERPAGRFNPKLVQLWDDLFAMCERVGLRILLTPFDTFWTWLHWRHHPYNQAKGGPLDHPSRLLLCGATRELIKARLRFAAARWGGSGALFAWDLWNEIHPAQAQDSAHSFNEFIGDLSACVRQEEVARFGRAHPQTVSLFGPELTLKPQMDLAGPIFRHPDLDFANLHIYASGTIDHPRNTVDPAIDMGRIVRRSLTEIQDGRPFFDSEHGPIHTFKDRKRTLPEPFDDEYFRHLQWAHVASGGAGGGMRWPNRHPHALTAGMRRAQAALARFTPLIAWSRFRRRNLNSEIVTTHSGVAAFGCGDEQQAVVWLLRKDRRTDDGRVDPAAPAIAPLVRVPGLESGRYKVSAFDTGAGRVFEVSLALAARGAARVQTPPFVSDVALAITREP
jgi:mannan endo-1,4-beta-mannosidase